MAIELGTIYGDVRLSLAGLQADAEAIKAMMASIGEQATMAASDMNLAKPIEEQMGEAGVAAKEGMTEVAQAVESGGSEATAAAEESTSGIVRAFSMMRDQIGSVASGMGGALTGAFGSLREAGATLAEGLGGVGEGLTRVGHGFLDALSSGTDFLTGMLEFQALAGVTTAITDFAGSLVGANAMLEGLHQQLASITGSGKVADQMLDWVKKFGMEVPDTTTHLAQATVIVQSLGVNAEQAMPALAQIAAAMGTDLPTAAHAFADAYEGRFMMMQMQLHINKDQLEQYGLKVSSTGKVVDSTLLPAIERLAHARFPNALPNQMDTLNGKMTNLTDRVEAFARKMGGPIFQAAKDALGALFAWLDKNQKTLDALGLAVGGFIAGAFRTLGQLVSGTVGFLTTHQDALNAVKFVFIGLAAALGVFLLTLLPSIPAMVVGIGALATTIGSLVVAAAPFIAIGLAIAGLVIAIKHAYDTSVPFRNAVNEIVARLRVFAQLVMLGAKTLMADLAPFLQQAGTHLRSFAGDLMTRVGPALTNIMHFLQMVGGWVEKVFIAIWPTLQQVLGGVWNAIVGIIQIAWSIISGIFKIILDVIGGNWSQAWNDLKDMLGGVLQGIIKLLLGLLQAIGPILLGLGQLLLGLVGGLLGGIGGLIGGLLGGIGNFIGQKIALWKLYFFAGITYIKAILKAGFDKVVEIITWPIRFVAGLFEWLFNHNYFFHDLVLRIQFAFNTAKQFITDVWTAITGWLKAAWERIKADAMLAWVLVQAYIINPIKQAIANIQEKLNWARTFIQNVWNQVKADVKAAWENFVAQITGAGNKTKTAVGGILDNVTKPIKDFIGTMFASGQKMIQMLIDGIKSMAGKVKDAAGNIIGNVAKFLQFHSPAEEGPGATADEWAPNLINMFAGGLDAGADKVRASALRAAAALKAGLAGSTGTLSLATAGAAAGNGLPAGAGGSALYITVPVTVNSAAGDGTPTQAGQQFGTTLGQALSAQLKQRGLA